MKNKHVISLLLVVISLSCAKQQYAQLPNSQSKTKIIAHRGFSAIAPENTLAAFQKAIDSGVEYFELDVHKTKDDSLVVIHDDSVNRTSSNHRRAKVAKMTYQELSKVKVGYSKKFGDKYTDEKIPTLREVLQLAKGKTKVCIEIKVHDIEEQVLQIVNDLQVNKELIIFSFYYDVLSQIRKLDKEIPILYLIGYANKSTIQYAKLIHANAIGVGYKTNPTKEFINTAHNNGIEIWKWTVNGEKQMRTLINRGLDGLITNFPDKALTERNNFHNQSYAQNVSNNTLSKEELINNKVKTLLNKMTLADKVGEMTQLALDMLCVGNPYNLKEPLELDQKKMRKVLVDLKVGSILNNGGHAHSHSKWFEIISTIQEMAMKEKKSGIPVIYGIDAIHGANYTSEATLFPQEINLAATWNPELVKELFKISAYETRASATPWSFAPVLDIGRDQRWSRFWETLGEDVFLATQMSTVIIEAMQGDDISTPNHVAACMKHFLGYSLPRTGKDRTPAYIPERQLKEYFIPTFQAAIDAGASTVMINSGEMNGIPVHADSKILIDLLRDELGFKGVAVTDWEDIKYLYTRHGVAKDYKDAIKMAINAGIDMSMVPVDLEFPVLLKELVEEGEVPMSRIDEAVSRILTLKYELNLFEKPVGDMDAYPDFASAKHEAFSLQGALESIVLVKNDNNTLPISKNKKILVTGPTAHSLNALNGGWTGTWQGTDPKYNTSNKQTVYEAFQNQFGKNNITYVEGTTINKTVDIPAAVAAARNADLAVICVGEMPYTEKPGDIHDLNLPEAQIELVEAIAKTNTPIVLVLIEGRPRVISKIEPLAKSVIFAGLPSNEGGIALAQIIAGAYNPNGKLPFTYPRFANDLMNYDYKATEKQAADFSLNAFNPQWEFGHGLSYTSFAYKNLKIEEIEDGKYNVSINLTNTGNRKGMETIQLFVRDKVASITPPVKRLRAFRKVELNAGESKTYTFSLTKDDLKFVGRDNKWIVEAGEFELMIDTLKASFTLKN